jgi:uncharacterized repeat protein (TIGR03803 family)
MMYSAQNCASVLTRNLRVLALSASLVCALTILSLQPAQAQTFNVLHNFTGGMDGSSPYAGLSLDQAGNLYGTTSAGGSGYGAVFELSRKGSGWVFRPLYSFAGGGDGEGPVARVVVGPNGTLYGTTYAGGVSGCSGGYGCGTVFNLRPSPTVCRAVLCPWIQTVLYRFNGGSDGANPLFGDMVFDPSGNLYGTTENGGGVGCSGSGCGTVFELSPIAGGWTEKILYRFTGEGSDGANPYAGVTFDRGDVHLYGTTNSGGTASNGTVFQLSPEGSSWMETVVYSFQGPNDGYSPIGGVIFDPSGLLTGTTSSGGLNGGGIAFQLNSIYAENVLYNFAGPVEGGPYGNLTADAAGNFYGLAYDDGAYGNGSIFKLSPSQGGWIFTDLYDFTGGSDGRCPYGGVLFDGEGNLYGTAAGGGQYGNGVVWKLAP